MLPLKKIQYPAIVRDRGVTSRAQVKKSRTPARLLVMAEWAAVLVSWKIVAPSLLVMAALPAVLVLLKSTSPETAMVAVPAVLWSKNCAFPPVATVKVAAPAVLCY